MRAHRFPIGRIKSHIAQHGLAVDQRIAHVFELLQNLRPFFVDVIRQFAQRKKIANAFGLVVDPARAAELRAQSHVREAVSARREARFYPRLFFEHHLLKPFFVVEFRGEEDVPEDVEHLCGFFNRGLASDHQHCRALSGLLSCHADRRAVDSARAFPNPLREFDVIFSLSS